MTLSSCSDPVMSDVVVEVLSNCGNKISLDIDYFSLCYSLYLLLFFLINFNFNFLYLLLFLN